MMGSEGSQDPGRSKVNVVGGFSTPREISVLLPSCSRHHGRRARVDPGFARDAPDPDGCESQLQRHYECPEEIFKKHTHPRNEGKILPFTPLVCKKLTLTYSNSLVAPAPPQKHGRFFPPGSWIAVVLSRDARSCSGFLPSHRHPSARCDPAAY